MNRWPVTIELPVQWGDQDSFGHVNNVVYLRWFESVRIAYWEQLGMKLPAPTGPILARQSIEYRLQLKYPDTLRVTATVTSIGNTSFVMGMRIRSRANDRAIVAEGEAVLVMFDYAAGRKVPVSEEWRRRIAALEATAPVPGAPGSDA